MRVKRGWKLLLAGALLAAALGGCALRPPPPSESAPAGTPAAKPAPHVGTPYDVVPQESLLLIRVYRGGTLASAGHNHIIASHDLSGSIYLPADIERSSFAVHVPVSTLTVDEATLRAAEASADFPPDVSESAKEGTRHNMLGPALLAAEQYPEIVLEALGLAAAEGGAVLARIQCSVRGGAHTISVPVRYERGEGTLTVSGETRLRQSDLGLTPFSALLGALQVQDEMRISFRIVAREARIGGSQRN
jgi:polyisoprenoid-binding protein YceI